MGLHSFLFQALIYTIFMYQVISYSTRLKSIQIFKNFSNDLRSSLRSLKYMNGAHQRNDDNVSSITTHSLKSAESGRITRSLFLSTSAFFGPSLSKALAATVVTSDPQVESSSETSQINKIKEEVIKRGNDKRDYSTFTLPNGIRVLVISDPQSVQAAAAMDVHVGSFSDPIDVPGLAHFCEHMSFLGTSRFPQEDEYASFLSSHGGSSNAYTDNEDTVYYFDVNEANFNEALDRFSQFFIAPLFTASATSRELNAIESEHAKNINDDGFRMYQLDKDASNPAHPLHKFATGNKETLQTIPSKIGLDVRKALLEFHSKYYSANQMTLCVYGPQPTATLQQWVKSFFSAVPNKQAPIPSLAWWGAVSPFNPQKYATLIQVVPINDLRRLTLNFPINIQNPAIRDSQLLLKPEVVLAHLIGHEGAGSIVSALRKVGWVNDIQSAVSLDISDAQVFEVEVDLTEAGFTHWNEIVDTVFSYIQLLKDKIEKNSLPKYILDEVAVLTRIGFEYSEASDPIDYVSAIVANMQVYTKPAEYLSGPRIYPTPDKDLSRSVLVSEVKSYLSNLTPDQCRIKLVGKSLTGTTDKVAPYYGTQFSERELPEETVNWSRLRSDPSKETLASTNLQLFLPNENIFIPRDFNLLRPPLPDDLSEAARLQILNQHPEVIRSDDKWKVWYKLDKSFAQPKAYLVINLAISKYIYDPAIVIASRLWTSCFLDSINEYLYDARLAELSFQFDLSARGMQLTLTGFNDKLPDFLSSVVKLLKEFRPEEKNFLRFKDLLRREFQSWKTQQPYSHASYYANLVSENYQFEIDSLVAALEATTVDSLSNLLPSILSSSFGTVLAIGNINDSTALSMVKTVEKTFPFVTIPRSERCVKTTFELPIATATNQGVILRNNEPNENDSNSAVSFYFQQPSLEKKDYLMLELLSDIVEQPFYNSLRTQQQLGYIVYSGVKVRHGVYHLLFTAQSSIVDGDELVSRIETFLRNEIPKFAKINKKQFETFKSGLLARKSEPDRRLTSQASRFWGEILFADAKETRYSMNTTIPPDFDRYEEEGAILKDITVEEFRNYVQSFLSLDKRRLLISQIDAQNRNDDSQASEKTTTSSSKKSNTAALKYNEIKSTVISDFRDSLSTL